LQKSEEDRMKLNIGTKISSGYAVALIILLLIGVISYQSITELIQNAELVSHSTEEIEELNQVLINLIDIETGMRGYIITGSETFLEPYAAGLNMIEENVAHIRIESAHQPLILAKLEKLESLIGSKIAVTDEIIKTRNEQGFDQARAAVVSGHSKQVMDEIRVVIDEIQENLSVLLIEESLAAEESATNAVNIITYGITVAFVILGVAVILITRSITIPLKETILLADQIAAGDLSGRATFVNRTDEIGMLANAFSKMTHSLSSAAEVAEQIALGDLDVNIDIKSEQDIMGNALSKMVTSLSKMSIVVDKIALGDLNVDIVVRSEKDVFGNALLNMIASLKEISIMVDSIAMGDLSVKINPRSENDVVGNALVTMVASLQEVISEIIEGVNILAASSSEIMASTSEVATGAVETASAISETSSTVEQVKQSAQFASEKSKFVSESTQNTVQVSESGMKAVDKSINGMTRIQDQVEFIAQSLILLSEQSQAIGEIITSVNDLAEQSNLLAVNASIEAAKAGEQGKGFAVVAQEVKILAEQSKAATGQVRTILNDILKATNTAVMATEQGSKAVETGVLQSKEAGKAISEMTEHIENAAQSALQINVANRQQLAGMDQITTAMQNIQTASAQNLDGAKQVELTVKNLHDLGQRLKSLVKNFKVSANENN